MDLPIDFKRLFGSAADGLFALALTQVGTFSGAARPILQGHAGGDIARAQALALQGMHAHLHVIKRHSDRFLDRFNDDISYADLHVPVARKRTTPIGTAPGVDPDADGLVPLSYLYGLQMPGPVSLHPHTPAAMPFQEDTRWDDLFVPPTYASQGLGHVLDRLRAYRQSGGTAVVLPALVGCVGSDADAAQLLTEIQTLVEALGPFADGFVWLPSLTDASSIWSPAFFRRVAQTMSTAASSRLLLVEMPATDNLQEDRWLELVDGFVGGGGHGIVAVGGRKVRREQTPDPASWPFDAAFQCGASLASYRQTAIEAARRTFPQLFIAACGGFHHRDEAFRACEYANVIVENEAFTRFGPGIVLQFLHKLVLRLRHLQRTGQIETSELWAFQQACWREFLT